MEVREWKYRKKSVGGGLVCKLSGVQSSSQERSSRGSCSTFQARVVLPHKLAALLLNMCGFLVVVVVCVCFCLFIGWCVLGGGVHACVRAHVYVCVCMCVCVFVCVYIYIYTHSKNHKRASKNPALRGQS